MTRPVVVVLIVADGVAAFAPLDAGLGVNGLLHIVAVQVRRDVVILAWFVVAERQRCGIALAATRSGDAGHHLALLRANGTAPIVG